MNEVVRRELVRDRVDMPAREQPFARSMAWSRELCDGEKEGDDKKMPLSSNLIIGYAVRSHWSSVTCKGP